MRLILAILLLSCTLARAADYHAGPDDYRSVLQRLRAGDRLFLAAGDYSRGLPLQGLQGEAHAPISIEGPATGKRARFLARRGANTISLADVAHVSIRNLEVDGGNLPVDAVKAEGHARFVHHVVLENLHIHDFAASQQNVGISSKCPAHGWVIRGNRIERVGTGMYLGNSDGSAPFVAGLIEGNRISDTLGYNLQIKHQKARPAGMPGSGARHDTVIRNNLFSKEQGGNIGAQARPNVLLGHWPTTGEGADDRYLVYANVFWQNPAEALFQGEGNLALYNNVFVNRHGPALRVQPHNDVPKMVDIWRNTVLARDEGIAVRLRPRQAPFRQQVARNLVFAASPLLGGIQEDNLAASPAKADQYLHRPWGDLMSTNLTPRLPLHATGPDRPDLPDYPDIHLDLAGNRLATGQIGALGVVEAGEATLASMLGHAAP